jgi:ubiquinone/menaquinone biosynthesis C-methylase UbiE
MRNPKKMSFSDNIDIPEAKAEHKFYFAFSRDYIKNKNVLDIGSWSGPFEKLIYGIAKKITAVDIEDKALKVLKQNFPKIKCVNAYADKLPFKRDAYDVVTFWDVIEHLPIGYEARVLKEINRVLKKNGYLIMATVNKNFWSDVLDPAYWLAGHRHYTEEKLNNLLTDAGFKIEQVKFTGSFVSSFYALSFYFFKHVLRRKVPINNYIEKKLEKDMQSKGFIQIALRAKKIS